MNDSGADSLSLLYPKGTDVLSCNRLLLKNDTLYVLSSGSVTICTLPPFPLFRLIFLSVCTVTVSVSPPTPFRIMRLILSKFTSCEAL